MLFSQITILPLAVTAGYNISRNAQWEQLAITRLCCIPDQFSQSILWVQKPGGTLLNTISFHHVAADPVPDTSILIQALPISLVSILSANNHQSPRPGPDRKHKQRQWNMMLLPPHTSGTFWKEWDHFKSMWNPGPVFGIPKRQATSLPWISLGLRVRPNAGMSNLCSRCIDRLKPGQRQKIRRQNWRYTEHQSCALMHGCDSARLWWRGGCLWRMWDGTRWQAKAAWCACLCLGETI